MRGLGLVASPDKPVPPTPVVIRVAPVAPVEMTPKPKSTGKSE